MDARARQIERQWRASGDANIHGALLTHLMRRGEIKEVALICAAFLGHPGAKFALPDVVKPTGVVFKGTLMKNEELHNHVYWLHKFGMKITWRAGLGVLRMAAGQMLGDDLDKLVKKTTIAVERETATSRETLQRFCQTTFRNTVAFSYTSRQGHLYRYSRSIAYQIAHKRHPTTDVQSISAYFKDEAIRNAIRGEVYPFLLGEYQ